MKKRVHLLGALGHDGSVGAHPMFYAESRTFIDVEEQLLRHTVAGLRVVESEGAPYHGGMDRYREVKFFPWWRVLMIQDVAP